MIDAIVEACGILDQKEAVMRTGGDPLTVGGAATWDGGVELGEDGFVAAGAGTGVDAGAPAGKPAAPGGKTSPPSGTGSVCDTPHDTALCPGAGYPPAARKSPGKGCAGIGTHMDNGCGLRASSDERCPSQS